MKINHTFLFFLLVLVAGFLMASCKNTEESNPQPELRIDSLREVDPFTVRIYVNVQKIGNDGSGSRGICFSSSKTQPDLNDLVYTDTLKTEGQFSVLISGLEKDKSYYFRAWAKNSAGLTLTNVRIYAPGSLPVIETISPTEVTGATVMTGINVTQDGGRPILEAGVCWDVNPDPDTSKSHQKVSNPGTGSLPLKIEDLNPTTIYYCRAYARNAIGITYGETKSFTTNELYFPGAIMTDQEGNSYPTIIILGKRWMAANLRTLKYNDGSIIAKAGTSSAWTSASAGAWCNYGDSAVYDNIYGKLYNWQAVNSENLCPVGWKVPSDAAWDSLINYLGDVNIAALKMRTTGTSLWNPPNEGATNSSGFSGVPGGNRSDFGGFGNKGAAAFFWTSTSVDGTFARFRSLNGNLPTVTDGYDRKKVGMSVRCMER